MCFKKALYAYMLHQIERKIYEKSKKETLVIF